MVKADRSKAKLIVDMPYNCWECIFRRPTISGFKEICIACGNIFDASLNPTSEKPEWCPLIFVEGERMKIILSDLTEISIHEEHIKERCKFVKQVFSTSIYFRSESSPETSGLSINYHGYPESMTKTDQARMLLAINAICNTNFEIEGYS